VQPADFQDKLPGLCVQLTNFSIELVCTPQWF
jgi:hypothetical protein